MSISTNKTLLRRLLVLGGVGMLIGGAILVFWLDPLGVRAAMEGDKAFGYNAQRETVFLERLSEGLSTFVTVLGIMVSVFFAVGAMIGAMITMYAAVANRQREIGTLRALGFSRTSILGSFLLESILLALLGGAIGCWPRSSSWCTGDAQWPLLLWAGFTVINRSRPLDKPLLSDQVACTL